MSKVVIEVLFPEAANLYGDLYNIKYLQKCLAYNGCETEVIEDELSNEPYFVKNEPNFIYMGPMTEHAQDLIAQKLVPLKLRIEELIRSNVVFLFTGNAMELLGEGIECEEGKIIHTLSFFPTCARRKMFQRYNSLILGKYEDISIVGFKSQFSHSYGDNSNDYFMDVIRGDGNYPSIKKEGFHRNHLFATYALGPILVLNPFFTKYILQLLGIQKPKLLFEEEAIHAYELRLKEFEDEKVQLN